MSDIPWSCTAVHQTWPGCGTCTECRRALAAGWIALADDRRIERMLFVAIESIVHDAVEAAFVERENTNDCRPRLGCTTGLRLLGGTDD